MNSRKEETLLELLLAGIVIKAIQIPGNEKHIYLSDRIISDDPVGIKEFNITKYE